MRESQGSIRGLGLATEKLEVPFLRWRKLGNVWYGGRNQIQGCRQTKLQSPISQLEVLIRQLKSHIYLVFTLTSITRKQFTKRVCFFSSRIMNSLTKIYIYNSVSELPVIFVTANEHFICAF